VIVVLETHFLQTEFLQTHNEHVAKEMTLTVSKDTLSFFELTIGFGIEVNALQCCCAFSHFSCLE